MAILLEQYNITIGEKRISIFVWKRILYEDIEFWIIIIIVHDNHIYNYNYLSNI